jgi:hypothetical protein
MKYVLNVRLVGTYLDVDESTHHNEIDPNADNPQWIKWELDPALVNIGGRFNPLSGSQPGFKWRKTPPDGTFDAGFLKNNATVLRITDAHTDQTTKGSWGYSLWVTTDDGEYHTDNTKVAPGGILTSSPLIKNK